MELHLVNKSDDGAIAALGVPLSTGAENAALAELFTKMQAAVTDEQSMVPLDGKIDPTDLIPPGSAIAGTPARLPRRRAPSRCCGASS